MIVIVVIGILVMMAAPNYWRYQRNAKCARTASEMRSLSTAFVAYMALHGEFPPDSHLTLPPGMEEFIRPSVWTDGTPLGGTYNWEGPSNYGYAALSVFNSSEPVESFEILDGLLDDGDLGTGEFQMISGRPTLFLTRDP